MAVEDQRAAIGFSITLSGQLIAASMATLAVECAYASYALGARLVPIRFFAFAGFAALLILLSVFKGGRGITKARNAGFAGAWSLTEGKAEFNAQATLLLAAVLMLGVAFFQSGPIKEQHVDQKLDALCHETEMLRKEVELHRDLGSATRGIEEQLRQVALQLQGLQSSPTPPAPIAPPEPIKPSRRKSR